MAIYDYLQLPEGVRTYLRLTSLGLGFGMYKAIDIAQQAGQNQVWGMDADTVKYAALTVGLSALASTLWKGVAARNRIDEKSRVLSIEDRVQSGDDNDQDLAA